VGLEAESFGFGAYMKAPQTVTAAGMQANADAHFIAVTTMGNLLVRYPGQRFQPYAGMGIGWSSGYLLGSDIQHGTDRVTGQVGTMTFAYQFFAGLRGYVTQKVFVFGEYKYFVAKYDWDGHGARPAVTLNLHAQLLSVGVGLSF
jgi:opacity protein-like surface antigen